MPKEVIRGTSFNVVVGWSQHCEVQLATEHDGPQSLKELVASWSDDGFQHRGLYSTLDRHQVNTLIKVLRRARDAAYGCDE